jgi:hypothetical protein
MRTPPPTKQTFTPDQLAEFARALIELVSHELEQSESEVQGEITLRLRVSVRFREQTGRIRGPGDRCCTCFLSSERVPLCLGDCC